MVSPSPASSSPVTNSTTHPPSAFSPPPTPPSPTPSSPPPTLPPPTPSTPPPTDPPPTPPPPTPSSPPPTLPPPTPSTPPPPTPSASPPPPSSPSHAMPPPPPHYSHPPPPGRHSPGSGSGGGSGNSWSSNGISMRVVVGVSIAGVALLLAAIIVCVCCARKKRKRRDYYGGRRSYYVSPPLPLPHSVPPQEGQYGVQMQQWEQNYSPPAEHYPVPPQTPSPSSTIAPRPPPRPPSPQLPPVPAPFMGRSPGSWSSFASENLFPPLSPANSLGYSSTFSYHELAIATNYFSEANMLGQGDFGNVHKGILPNGMEIAVKSLNSGSGQGEQEFQTEVEIIGRVHHKHLVSLVGYCITGSHWFLVYQFVPNRTLEFHLHSEGQPTMDWETRLRIALGSAKGLAYLHEDCHPKIIHGNMKSANILLNNKFEAKVADFGRAKVSPDGTHVSTRVIGTIGYLAPEYAATGKLSDKSDVFSFGVVLLELITGCPPVNPEHNYMNDSFVDWARPLLKRFLEDRKLDSLVDPRLQNKYDPSEMARMVVCATACLRHTAKRRPRMSQVVRALEGELSLTDNSEGVRAGPSTSYTSHSSDNNEALRLRYNSMYTSHSSDNDSSPYKEDMKRVKQVAVANQADGSSEYDGTTSEYGVYPSGLSSEIQSQETPRLMETRKVKDGKDGDGL